MLFFECNEIGYVTKIIINNETILINDLCREYSEQENRKIFILLLSDILRKFDVKTLSQEHIDIINYELNRFGINAVSNGDQLLQMVKNFDINFSYFIIQWVDYIKKTIGLPYDANFLFVSEILEHIIFNVLQQQIKNYTIKLKENNSFFVFVNTSEFKSIRNNRKLKIAIQKYSLNYKNKDIIFIPNDFLISISQEDITNTINISDCFKYFDRPNFVLNMFKAIGIEHEGINKLFSNYDLPLFFTDVFDIVLKKEKQSA